MRMAGVHAWTVANFDIVRERRAFWSLAECRSSSKALSLRGVRASTAGSRIAPCLWPGSRMTAYIPRVVVRVPMHSAAARTPVAPAGFPAHRGYSSVCGCQTSVKPVGDLLWAASERCLIRARVARPTRGRNVSDQMTELSEVCAPIRYRGGIRRAPSRRTTMPFA